MGRVLRAFGQAVLWHVLFGLLAPFLGVITLGLLARGLVRPEKSAPRPSAWEVLGVFAFVPCVFGSLAVPLRAAIQVVIFAWEGDGGRLDPWWRAVLVNDRVDSALGACGLVLSLVAMVGLRHTWAKVSEVQNLPTSRVRSAAAGLVELQGIARPAPAADRARERETHGPALDWDAIVPAGALLYKDSRAVPSGGSWHATCELTSRFVLEDATGRILIDARGAEFGAFNTSYLFGAPAARLALARDRLMEGDPVYVLGVVEERPDAAALAVDAERLVVSAIPVRLRARRASPSLLGFLRHPFSPRGQHIFFLSDVPESGIRRALAQSLLDTFASELILFTAALWLVLVHGAALWR